MAQEWDPHGERAKQPGLSLTKSGKWGVQLYHPNHGATKWLEIVKDKKTHPPLHPPIVNNNIPIINCGKDSQSVIKYKGVRQTRPGRWCAEIKDPFRRKSVHLGTFNTPEEAANVFAKKRREFDDELMALGRKRRRKGDDVTTGTNKNVSLLDSKSEGIKNQNEEDEFGVGVIDELGRLIGEYSRIDDELWVT